MVTPCRERLAYYLNRWYAEWIFMTAGDGLDADARQAILNFSGEIDSFRMRLIAVTDPARRYA